MITYQQVRYVLFGRIRIRIRIKMIRIRNTVNMPYRVLVRSQSLICFQYTVMTECLGPPPWLLATLCRPAASLSRYSMQSCGAGANAIFCQVGTAGAVARPTAPAPA